MVSFIALSSQEEASRRCVGEVPGSKGASRRLIVIGSVHLEAWELDDLGGSICRARFGDSAGTGARNSGGTACRGNVRRKPGRGGLCGGRIGVTEGGRRRDVISQRSEAVVFIAPCTG